MARTSNQPAQDYPPSDELQEADRLIRDLQVRLQTRIADAARAEAALRREVCKRERAERALRSCEEALLRSQGMETVGKLAAGMAHDLNNLLAVILCCSNLAIAGTEPEWDFHDELEDIRRSGLRARELTAKVLAMVCHRVTAPQMLEPNALIADFAGILQRIIGKDVELSVALDPAAGKVMADPGQIEQVIMNLVVNARDAMPGGGIVTIASANVDLDESSVFEHASVLPGRYVMLSVSDTGVGMDQATAARVFEPFFTTKPCGQGTGLGLSTVFAVVAGLGGGIRLRTEPGVGTTFEICLPRVT